CPLDSPARAERSSLSLHDALPICRRHRRRRWPGVRSAPAARSPFGADGPGCRGTDGLGSVWRRRSGVSLHRRTGRSAAEDATSEPGGDRDGRRNNPWPQRRFLPTVELMTTTTTADDLAATLLAAAADSDFSGVIRVDQGERLVTEQAYGLADRAHRI